MSEAYQPPPHLPASPPAIEAPSPPALLRRAAAASLLGISPTSLDRWRAAGLMPAGTRTGSLLLFDRSELLAWLAAGRPKAAEWSPRWAMVLRRRK